MSIHAIETPASAANGGVSERCLLDVVMTVKVFPQMPMPSLVLVLLALVRALIDVVVVVTVKVLPQMLALKLSLVLCWRWFYCC
jgi:hypothetical protein